jgi:hypothetical protein
MVSLAATLLKEDRDASAAGGRRKKSNRKQEPYFGWMTSSPTHALVSHYVFDKARINSAPAVDFNCGSNFSMARARSHAAGSARSAY